MGPSAPAFQVRLLTEEESVVLVRFDLSGVRKARDAGRLKKR